MARILFLTQLLPYPLDAGAKIRAYYVLRHLARHHEVTLVSFVRWDDAPDFVAHLAPFCRAVHTVTVERSPFRDVWALLESMLTGRPVIIARDEIGAMHRLLRHLMRKRRFDVVHADQTSMAQYGLYARAASQWSRPGPGPRLVLDAHNALCRIPRRMARHETNLLKRLLLQREARLLRRYERETYRGFDHVTFVTDVDRTELLQAAGCESPMVDPERPKAPSSGPNSYGFATSTIPICVDPSNKRLIERRSNPRSVTHLGTMVWPPNVQGVLWFAQHVWPRVLEQVPEARFHVIGKNPPREVCDLHSEVRGIGITGYVQDPGSYLAETAVFIVPLRAGGGMRVKIVDAWCWGLPIVSTSIGAESIEVEEGKNILIADSPEAMTRAVVRVLTDPALSERLREHGRRWVEERYDWRRIYRRWDGVYEKLMDPKSRPQPHSSPSSEEDGWRVDEASPAAYGGLCGPSDNRPQELRRWN